VQIEPEGSRAMIQALRREGARGPWLALLEDLLRLAGPAAQFLHHAEKPWSSATFAGARHRIAFAFEGPEAVAAGETFIAALPGHAFTLRGHLVVDATVSAAEHSLVDRPRLSVEAELLVLDDA